MTQDKYNGKNNMNSEQKVSQMILDVAGQFILMVESEEERQTHLDIACAAQNISILPKNIRDKEYKKYFNKMKSLLNDLELIKYFEMDLNGLIDAKIDSPLELRPSAGEV